MTSEHKIKHQRVCEYLQKHKLDAVLLSRRCNFSWYTCGAHNHVDTASDTGCSWLLVTQDGATVLTTNIEATRLRAEELADSGIEVIEFPYHDSAARSSAFAGAIGKMSAAQDAPSPADLPALSDDFDQLRWVLTDDEIARYTDLCIDVAACVEFTCATAETGQTENELAGRLSAALHAAGCNPSVLLVGADERLNAHRHPLPTDNAVKRIVMMVTCAERDGLVSACTRIVSFAPLEADLSAKHKAVTTVDAAMISATRVGATLGDVLAVGIEAYEAAGFGDQWRLHHQGGSCGYLSREVIATPGMTTPILADQAFAWNPSITGTKSEDTVICRADGAQVMAVQSNWPMIEVQCGDQAMLRPDILVK